MLRKLLFFLIGLSIYSISLSAYPQCAPELSHILRKIYLLPEGKEIIQQVEAEGPVRISLTYLQGSSKAMWLGSRREVILNSSKRLSDGQRLCSILFEFHNALTNKEFYYFDGLARRGMISKNDYILSIEKIEHQNALKAKALIEKGIHLGIFPRDALWNIPSSFEQHFAYQQYSGHSEAIGQVYDSLNPYRYCMNMENTYR